MPAYERGQRQYWIRKRLVAYPVHTTDPFEHWSLGVVYNRKWDASRHPKGIDMKPEDMEWCHLHYDSLTVKASFIRSKRIAEFILDRDSRSFDHHSVTTIKQPEESNDCALYPPHFLRIIICDLEKQLEFALKVRAYTFQLPVVSPSDRTTVT